MLRSARTRAAGALRRAGEWLRPRVRAVGPRLSPERAMRVLLAHAQTGQSMVEYAVIVALVAIVAMGAIQLLGGGITTVFQNILTKITTLGR